MEMKTMKKYTQPQVKEILLDFENVIAISNGNEEGEGEYSRKMDQSNDTSRTSGFSRPLWSDL